MRLLRREQRQSFVISWVHPFLLAFLLSPRKSRKPENGSKPPCWVRSVNGERVGIDSLRLPTPLRRYMHLRRPSPSATHHGRFAHVRPSGPPPTSKWLVTVSVFRSTTAT